jgi:outer membrane protein TolC
MLSNSSFAAEQITIDEVRELALANSSTLARLQLTTESARLDEKNRVYGNLPSLSLGVSASAKLWGETSFPDSLTAGASIGVSQTLFDGGKSGVQKAINAIASEQTRQEALAAYFDALDAADSAYYETLKAMAAAETAAETLETAALSLSMAELRLGSGMINQRDYLKAMADRSAGETAWNRALRDLALARAQLKSITGLEELPELAAIDFSAYEELIRFLSSLPENGIGFLNDSFSAAAAANNPDLLKSSLALQMAERNVGLAKKDYLPSLSARVSTGINYAATNGLSYSDGSVSLSGSIPLDYWVIGTAVAKKRVAQSEAALGYRDAENSLAITVQTGLLDLIYNALTVQSARQADEYAQQNYGYNLELYKLSRASVFELSDAAKSAGENHSQRIAAEYAFLGSLSKLRSLGAFDSQDDVINLLLSRQ